MSTLTMKTVAELRSELEAKYPAAETAKKMTAAVQLRQANGGDVSMFPKSMRRTVA